MRKIILSFVAIILFNLCIAGQNNFFESSESFGKALNSATGQFTRQSLEPISNPLDAFDLGGDGPRIIIDAVEVSNFSDFITSKNTQLSAGASGKYGAFKASVNYSQKIFRKFQISSYKRYLVIKVIVTNPQKTLKDKYSKLSPLALSQANQGDAFLRDFGDSFVYRIAEGGELYIIYEFDSLTQSENSRANLAINAAVSYFGAKGTASYSSEEVTNAIKRNTNKKTLIIRNGSEQPIPEFNAETLVNYAREDFQREVIANPFLIGVYTREFKDAFNSETTNVKFVKLRNQQKVLDHFFELKNQLQKNINNAQFVLENHEKFDLGKVREALDDYKSTDNCVKEIDFKYNNEEVLITSANYKITLSAVPDKDKKICLEDLTFKVDTITTDEELEKQTLIDIKNYVETGKDRILQINRAMENCEMDFNSCSKKVVTDFPAFVFPPKIGFIRNKVVTEKEIITRFPTPVSDGNSAPTPIGYCDWYEIKYISFRGPLFYKGKLQNYLIPEKPLFEIWFSESPRQGTLNDYNIIKKVAVQADEIKWLPGTYAYVVLRHDLGVSLGLWGVNEGSYCKLGASCNQAEFQRRNVARSRINSNFSGSQVKAIIY